MTTAKPAFTFRLHIHTRTPAFETDARREIAACLRRIAYQLEQTPLGGDLYHPNKIADTNREDCGRWFMRRETE